MNYKKDNGYESSYSTNSYSSSKASRQRACSCGVGISGNSQCRYTCV